VVPGATFKNYTNPAVDLGSLGFYQVIASNAVGVVTSSVAQLTFGPVAAWGRNLNNECLPPPGLTNVFAVAGSQQGIGASFALRTDGTIIAWGAGAGTNIPASANNVVSIATSPTGNTALRSDGRVVSWNGISAPALTNILALAAGNNFGYALRADGTLTNWGGIPTPGFASSLNQLTAIACGYNNAVALRSDGKVFVSGITAVTNVPGSVTNVIAVAAGYTYAMALRADGKVIAWGTGTITNLPTSLTNIVAISAGNYPGENFGLAMRADGKVVAFGDNSSGETNPPAALTNLVSIAVAAAPFHGLALVNDGSPVILYPPIGQTAFTGRDVMLRGVAAGAATLSYQWLLNGTNLTDATNSTLPLLNLQLANAGNYQLFVSNAIGTAISLPAPLNVIVSPLTIASQITATPTNLYQAGKFTVGGITVNGSGPLRYQWFFSRTNNGYAAIVGATNDTLLKDPAFAFDTGNYFVAISNLVGGLTSAPVNVRVLFARGFGYNGVTNPPVNVTNAIALATGGATGNSFCHYLALGADGKVTTWASYLQTSGFTGETNLSSLSNSIVTALAASLQHTLALKSDGTVSAFGIGATNVPNNLSGITAIACGGTHDLALKSDGTVVGWLTPNALNYGQATNTFNGTNLIAIAAGQYHSLGLQADGSVIGWGNVDGSLSIPASTLKASIAIAAGNGFGVALRTNGTVVQWGGGITSYPVPANLSNVVAISASGQHVTALRNDGTVTNWGFESQSFAINFLTNNPVLTNVIGIASGGDHDVALFGTRAPAFTVQPWNRAVTPSPAFVTSAALVGKVAGVQPMSYQWRLNGTNYPGATNDTFVWRDSQHPAGTYQLVASNSYGVAISKPAKVTIVIPLAVALDTTTFNWLTSGSAPWFGQTNITHDGVDAARSGGIGGLQETILQTTLITNFPGSVSFWWKISSEQFFDTLEFRVNGTVQGSISGEVDWTLASFPIATGTNILLWRYSKDSSFDSGLDAAFVDQFAFASAPVINVQPSGVIANLGQNVALHVVAAGTAQLGYQWTQNGTPVGGNSANLILNNVARAQGGTYSVIVTNSGGMAVSSNAAVVVKVPQLLGTPVLLPDGSLQLTSADANGGTLTEADLANFEAQASTNLVNWTTLPGGLNLTNGMLQLNDAARTNFTSRYYRIVEH
jgi:alpha-tubulin suppressor-like RCC1 family protein